MRVDDRRMPRIRVVDLRIEESTPTKRVQQPARLIGKAARGH